MNQSLCQQNHILFGGRKEAHNCQMTWGHQPCRAAWVTHSGPSRLCWKTPDLQLKSHQSEIRVHSTQSVPRDYGGICFHFFFPSLFFLCRGMGRTVIQLDKLLVRFSKLRILVCGWLGCQPFEYPLGPSKANDSGGCIWGRQSGFSCASYYLLSEG